MRFPNTAVLLLLTTIAFAQTATLTGIVTDPDGGAVREAGIDAKNLATGAKVRATTAADGAYRFALPPGNYDISISMPCCQYGSFAQSAIAITAGESRNLNIRLPWGANLGTIADDPILLLNEFRERAAVRSGPTPRMPGGKPDLSGIWINVYNPDTPPPPLQPWADELHRERQKNNSRDYPGAYCLPANAAPITRAFPYKFVQTSNLIVVLHESDTPGVRQVFLDGRSRPTEINPTWEGYSIGHWESDTLVVETANYNDRSWLSLSGIPHTEKLHTIERIRRPQFGRLEIEITMDDSDAFTGPWKRTFAATLAAPEEEIMEFVCGENNRDIEHYRGK
jgi:hypothetical protein